MSSSAPPDKTAAPAPQERSPEDLSPSSVDGLAHSLPVSGLERRRTRAWVHLIFGALSLAGPALFVVGTFFWGDRSMDFPTDGAVRLGLMGNEWLKIWQCSEHHQHYSAPFWMASGVLLLGTLLLWRKVARLSAEKAS